MFIDAWACGRDPNYWEDAESFKPERFENLSIDFMGNDFEFIPFGGGKENLPQNYFWFKISRVFSCSYVIFL